MIIDARDQLHDSVVTTDVCIVGAGVAGIAMALELGGAGFRVLLLEAGDRTPNRADQRLGRGESVGHPYFHLDTARIRAFGGSSNHWVEWSGLRARPLDDLDFESRPEVGRGGWPFGKAELDPFYARAQEICNLGPYDYETSTWSGKEGREPLALPTDLASTVVFQIGPLGQFAARLAEILAPGNTSLMLHANVLQIRADDLGTRATRVEVSARPGHRFDVEAQVFVLASGGLENARLLLASDSRHPRGLGNAEDLVGRFFTEHPHVNTGVVVPRTGIAGTDLYRRQRTAGTEHIAMIKLTDEVLRREGLLSSAWALVPVSRDFSSPAGQSLAELRALAATRDVRDYAHLLPGTVGRLRTAARHPGTTARLVAQAAGFKRQEPTRLALSMMAEQLPDRQSRIMLSDRRNSLGSRMAKLDWRVGDVDRDNLRRTQRLLSTALEGAGLGRIEQLFDEEGRPPAVIRGGYHPMGTTRMHVSPREGVVDAECRVHGMANLYVAGMSVFPTVGYANPTLTVVALAVRVARHVRRTLEAPAALIAGSSAGSPSPAQAGQGRF